MFGCILVIYDRSSGRGKVLWDLQHLGAIRRNGEGTCVLSLWFVLLARK